MATAARVARTAVPQEVPLSAASGAGAPPSAAALLRRTVRRHASRLLGAYVFYAMWATSEALVPVVIGETLDRGTASGDTRTFLLWLALLGALMLVLSLGYRNGARIGMRAVQGESHALRVEVAAHALHPRGARTGRPAGETLALATGDADAVGLVLRLGAYALASLTAVGVAAVYLLRLDVALGVVVLVGVPVVLALGQAVSPAISRRAERQQALVARAAGLAADTVRGLRPLAGIGGQDVAVARYRQASAVARDASIRTARSFGALFGLTSALSGVFLAAVALLAGRLALAGEISLGELIAVVGLTQFLAEPLAGLGETGAYLAAAHGSAGRIAAFLATPRLVAGGADTATGDLVLTGVSAGPLTGVDLRTAPGRLTAVLVDDPAAADALVGVLRGELTPVAGTARLGTADLAALDAATRHTALVVSPHQVDLFEGTVHDTVDPDRALPAVRLDVVLAASAAGDVVAAHPDGLAAPVAAAGTTLSGGQRQRLALARALACPAPVLVLHEPTSAVDAVTEAHIARGLRTARHAGGSDLATVVLTSGPALLAVADEVVVVRAGRTVATGPHHALLADAAYREAVAR